jgi:adenine-specific DNA-methyltransferase
MNNNTNLTELGHSPDAWAQRQAELLALLRQAAPEVLSDNRLNLEKLKELLGEERIAPAEHYELNWAGKTEARREIQKTSSHTLRPDASNPAHAQHMLIEGENLEVLRVLQKSYYGKVKMIYIDPPYNTGNDSFVYPDDYSETLDDYQKRTGEKSAEGYLNKQSLWKKNSKESGQYHSAWLSMMYPRLYLARNLLRDDGVIFISIDDNEAANLKLLCDEVFGEANFVAQIIVIVKPEGRRYGFFAKTHDYVLVYSRNHERANLNEILVEGLEHPYSDDFGGFTLKGLRNRNVQAFNSANRPNLRYPFFVDKKNPDGNGFFKVSTIPLDGYIRVEASTIDGLQSVWRWGREKSENERQSLLASEGNDGQIRIFQKERKLSQMAKTVLADKDYISNKGTRELQTLLGKGIFDFPKPVALLELVATIGADDTSLVLDFFSGSGTTAHAVMELNAEDGGSRQCISVQMPEVLDESSEAYKAGYRTIADITRARITKVIAKLKAEHPDKTGDLACAHFTLAPSNFKVWRSDVGSDDALREQLALFQSAEKGSPSTGSGRTGGAGSERADAVDAQSAMLTELLLKHGLGALGVHAISKPKQVAGVTVHRVLLPDDKAMWLCFEPYTEALRDEIVNARPAQVVLLNSCFVGDKADEQLANLQLELAGLDIGLTVI